MSTIVNLLIRVAVTAVLIFALLVGVVIAPFTELRQRIWPEND